MPILGIENTPEDEARRAAIMSKTKAIYIASLISILFCCVGGIAASIVANRAKNDADSGDLDAAERQINIALILMIISYAVGISSLFGQLSRMR